MTEQKQCVRCNRPIDAYARSCVYCGWDQAAPPPLEEQPTTPLYVPPPDNRLRNRVIGTVAFVALVIIALAGSMIVRASNDAKAANAAARLTADASDGSTPHSIVTLVPVEGGETIQPETPVTTVPSAHPLSTSNADPTGERADATALPSEAYAIATRRAKTEREVKPNNGTIDPRSIIGSAEPPPRHTDAASPPPPTDSAPSSETKAVPLYQPVPSLSLDQAASARLTLTVGSDGSIQSIDVAQALPDEMPRLIAAVHSWRYKPATLNGQPVTSTLSVDINVHPR
ncbi:MAG TPA: energy transducer TonB [Thermoanaerobaculia bacterium]|jgi:hypothetical protein|nr:energy transducer TonB [Thermoanaerobaculia bacterium]